MISPFHREYETEISPSPASTRYLRRMFLRQLLFWILIAPGTLWAQEPFYHLIGEEELSGIHVYSLAQDRSGLVWIATDQGLFRYDSYEFQLHPGGNSSDPALFSLGMDTTGHLYCLNLLGQIYQIGKDSLELYFQIPDSLLSASLEIMVDDENMVVVTGRQLFRINRSRKAEIISPRRLYPIAKAVGDGLICLDLPESSLFHYKDGKIVQLPTVFDHSKGIRMIPISNAQEVRILSRSKGIQYLLSATGADSLSGIVPQFGIWRMDIRLIWTCPLPWLPTLPAAAHPTLINRAMAL